MTKNGEVVSAIKVNSQLVINIIAKTTISVKISAMIVMTPWEKTVFIVSTSLMVRVVEVPIGVLSK